MAIVAGVDFGTLSVRVTLFDSERGRLGRTSGEYPLHRRPEDPDYATQAHDDHMRALVKAMQDVLLATNVEGAAVEAIALDTTGSSVVMVDDKLQPLDEFYLWCDHRAHDEAREITTKACAMNVEAIAWCGGTYSHEWGWSKLLHWLRHASAEKRARFATALEHCDMVAATLTGVNTAAAVKRSVCAMGHKWMWSPRWDGFPPEEFWVAVDPLLSDVRGKMAGDVLASNEIYGKLSTKWAAALGLRPGIPVPAGA
jgi:L-ribulokinase